MAQSGTTVEPLRETGYYKWLKVAQRLSNATIYPGRPPIRQLPHDNPGPPRPSGDALGSFIDTDAVEVNRPKTNLDKEIGSRDGSDGSR